jgi:hypothetical protein
MPDTKDWSWVVRRPCPECGLDASVLTRADIPTMLSTNAAGWRPPLSAPGNYAARPTPEKWSPLEYACHVRDLLVLCDHRLNLMLTQDDPTFANWDQDAAAATGRYGELVPADVATEITDAAAVAAGRFARVTGDQWLRKGRRSDGARFTVETYGRHLVHEAVHHLYDVTGVQHSHGGL